MSRKGQKGIKWGEGSFTKGDKARWMSSYLKPKRSDARLARERLKESGCILCGYVKCLAALEFHHVNDDKMQGVSDARSVREVQREATKCIMVCANCHREIHAGQIEGYEDIQRAVPIMEEPPLLRLIERS